MESPNRPEPPRRELLGAAAILVLLVALFHGAALKNGFVYDDAWTIVDNPFLRAPANVLRVLGPEPARAGVPDAGRPTLLVTEIVDHALWGLSPRGFHLQNLLWHVAVVVLFFLGAAAVAGGLLLPFLAAALVAIHPLNVEAVAAINYREDLLAAFFVLAALAALGRGEGRALSRIAAFLLCLVGVLAKETAMMAPVLLVLVEIARGRRIRAGDAFTLAAAAATGFCWRALVIGGAALVSRTAEIPDEHHQLLFSLPEGAWSFVGGVARIVWPWGLSPDYPELGRRWLGWLAVVGLAGAVALAARRRTLPALGFLWAIAAYVPTLGFFPISNLRADRYFYLPSLGLFLALAALLVPVLERIPGRPIFELPRAWLVAGALLVALGVRTLHQGRIWREELALWSHATRVAPGASRAWALLAEAQLRRGATMAALEAVQRSLALADDVHARELEGIILMEQGDLARACPALAHALSGAPEHHRAELLNNLGYCELRLGRLAAAASRFAEARRLSPRYDRAWINAAAVLEQQGQGEEAIRLLRELVRAVPESAAARQALEEALRRASAR